MRRHMSRPSPAMVVACTALIVALGGTSYAAFVPRNSVGSKQLKKNAVTRSKIKKNAVTGSKIANRSVSAADLKAGTLPIGVGTLAYRELTTTAVPGPGRTGLEVLCPPGLFAISGQIDAGDGLAMQSSYSSNGAGTAVPGVTAWIGVVENLLAVPIDFTVIVTCAPAGAIARKSMSRTVRTKRADFTLKTGQ